MKAEPGLFCQRWFRGSWTAYEVPVPKRLAACYAPSYTVVMKPALDALAKAIAFLDSTLRTQESMASRFPDDVELQNALRAGVVQNFEFTYELCWKFMKRWLENNVGSVVVDGVSRRELFRLAAESRLIDDVPLWMSFHTARNQTSHTYEMDIAREVASMAPALLAASKDLIFALAARND